VETDPTRMCELLVGLPAVTVLGVEGTATSVVVHVELRTVKAGCPSCGVVAWVKDRPTVDLADLPAFGRPPRLVWHKHRWCCPDRDCPVGSFTGEDARTRAYGVHSSLEVCAFLAWVPWGVVVVRRDPSPCHPVRSIAVHRTRCFLWCVAALRLLPARHNGPTSWSQHQSWGVDRMGWSVPSWA
jgi:hypothetical protein